jgi:hypothetical protein
MDRHEFCDHCPGCRPAVIDWNTGAVLPQDSALAIAVNRAWNTQTSYAERKAFIEVTLHNSRAKQDLQLASEVIAKIKAAMRAVPGG